MAGLAVTGGRILAGEGVEREAVLRVEGERIAALSGTAGPGAREVDAAGFLVLPGLVDFHGDAFERQLMPRPGVQFATELALIDTDRQLAANGITTAFHAITLSWEPGLRSREQAADFLAALDRVRPALGCEARVHLRFETFNLEAEAELSGWISDRRIDLLAFNDHTPGIARAVDDPQRLGKFAERAKMEVADFAALVRRVHARQAEVPAAIERLAAGARAAGLPMASHDDATVEMRDWYHALGCHLSEFPLNEPTAARARDQGGHVVFGAPNVVRGGSHLSGVSAASMVAKGLCDILASDYYYPALCHAAFRLVREGTCGLARAWALVAANPAAATGLDDRGTLAPGKRADFVLVDDSVPGLPRIVATFVAGRPVFLADGGLAPALPSSLASPLPSPLPARAAGAD